MRLSVTQFCSVDELCVRIFISLIKPIALVRSRIFSQISNRSALYTKYKTGEIGEPCSIPTETLLSGSVKSLTRISVNLFNRKFSIQCISSSGILLFRKLCKSLIYNTKSNAPLTSRLNKEAILCLFSPYII